jgi:hypothetical protein
VSYVGRVLCEDEEVRDFFSVHAAGLCPVSVDGGNQRNISETPYDF